MAKSLSAQPITVEIDGNEYTIPAALTPRVRGEVGKHVEAYAKAYNDQLRASLSMQEARTADDAVKASKAADAARAKEADAARALIVALLKTKDGQPAPDGIGDSITDAAATDIAADLTTGATLQLDPPNAA